MEEAGEEGLQMSRDPKSLKVEGLGSKFKVQGLGFRV